MSMPGPQTLRITFFYLDARPHTIWQFYFMKLLYGMVLACLSSITSFIVVDAADVDVIVDVFVFIDVSFCLFACFFYLIDFLRNAYNSCVSFSCVLLVLWLFMVL